MNLAVIRGFPSFDPMYPEASLDSSLNAKGLALSLLPVTYWATKYVTEEF